MGALLSIEFDNQSTEIRYWTSVSNWVVSTMTLSNSYVYTLTIDIDYVTGTMTVLLDGLAIASNVHLTANGSIPRITGFYPVWNIINAAHPGNNYMVFDDYKIALIGNPPLLTKDLVNQTAEIGGQVQLQVNSTGHGLLTYDWYFNNQKLNVPNTNTLVLSNFQGNQAGSYYVVVSDYFGATQSHTVQVGLEQSSLQIAPNSPQGQFGMNVTTMSGKSYTVEFKNALNPGTTWQVLTNFTGAGSVYYIQQPMNASPARFYRLKSQ
jgi:hypothetical protein